jgi:putative FmdB family regulatory protein
MPYYDFHCYECDTTFTERRSFSRSDDPAVCACGSPNTHKLLNAVAFKVAGGGSRSGNTIPLNMAGGSSCASG